MEFYKANLLSIKLLKRPSRFMYFRLANASELWVLWFHISWRRSWLPQAAYQMGWDAAFRHIYMIGMSPDQLLEKYANVPARAAELPLERNGGDDACLCYPVEGNANIMRTNPECPVHGVASS